MSTPDPRVSATSDRATEPDPDDQPVLAFDRHLVLEQLGGWRGMLDATLPTVAFIVANAVNGLRTGIWAALGAAFLVFVLRLVRRESVQQAVSGLFAVGVAVRAPRPIPRLVPVPERVTDVSALESMVEAP